MNAQSRTGTSTSVVAGLMLLLLLIAMALFAAEPRPIEKLPATVLAAVEIDDPGRSLDTLDHAFYGESVRQLAAAVAEWEEAPEPMRAVADVLARREADPRVASALLDATAGGVVIAVMPGADDLDLVPVVAMRAVVDDVSVAAEDLVQHVLDSRLENRGSAEWVVRHRDGETIARLTIREEWIVVGPPDGGRVMDEVASALVDDSNLRRRFGDLVGPRQTLDRLPLAADLRMAANPEALAKLLARRPEVLARVAATEIGSLESFGVARTLRLNGVGTRMIGQLAIDRSDGALATMIARMAPVTGDLERRIPRALVSVEVGVDMESWIQAAAFVVRDAAPSLATRIGSWIEDFEDWSGMHPSTDLLPFLGRGMVVALLAPDRGSSTWPLPRPVLMARVEDEAAVERFAERWVRFKAGSLAPATGGLLGGRVVHREVDGVSVHEIVVDGLLPGPVPSPATAVDRGVVIASPFASAVTEVLRYTPIEPRDVPAEAVELIRIDGKAIHSWWKGWTAAVAADGHPVDPGAERVVRAGLALLEELGPATGATRVATDGSFCCEITLTPSAGRPERLR